jgi:7,8-dihydroneopterin aldolase/epimerase/oxygenase
MSDSISIKGINGFGYHGVFEHETKNGQAFFVDLTLKADLSQASLTDSLADTIDYGAVCDLALKHIEGVPVQLIEKLAGNIAQEILETFALVNSVVVTVHKPQAPVHVEVLDIAVSIERAR